MGAETYRNVEAGHSNLRPAASREPAVIVLEMRSPYIYLGGKIRFRAFTTGLGDSFAISVSTDNGRSYKSVLASTKSGDVDANMDLSASSPEGMRTG